MWINAKNSFFFIILVLSFALPIRATPNQFASSGLEVKIPQTKSTKQRDFNGLIEFQVANNSTSPVKFVKWGMPIAGDPGDFFDVFYNGEIVPYKGVMMRRGIPRDSDFIILYPGEVRRVTVDLSESYDIERAGHYIVRYKKLLTVSMASLSKTQSHSTELLEVFSKPVEFNRAEDTEKVSREREFSIPSPISSVSLVTPNIAYRFCSVQQQDITSAAHSLARSYASDARASLAANIQGPRYRTWFGVGSARNVETVTVHFDNIDFTTRSGITEFLCDCTEENAYAYVRKDSGFTQINLCPRFWSASNAQRANTIIHELSHLSDSVGAGADGTEDHVYGQSQAQQLATSNPGLAVDNAENYGYYAQNPYGQRN